MITVAEVYAVSAVTTSNTVNKSIAEAMITAMTEINTQISQPAFAKADLSQVMTDEHVDMYV